MAYADYVGRLGIKFGLGKEVTRGTAVVPTQWVKHLSSAFEDNVKYVLNESGMGLIEKYNDAEIVETWGAGNLKAKVTDQSFGLILTALFSQSPTTALHTGETAVWDHTYALAETVTGTSLTLAKLQNGDNFAYARAMLAKLELDVTVGQYIEATSDWITAPSATGTNTAAYVTENEFVPSMATAKIASTKAGLAAATAIPLHSVKLTFNKNVNPDYVFGSTSPSEIFTQGFEVDGEFVLRHTDDTYRNLWSGGTFNAFELDLKNTLKTIGTASNPEVTFTLDQVVFDTWKTDQALDKIVDQTVTFKAMYNIANTELLSAVFTNTVDTGY